MKILKQILINSATAIITIAVIGSAYAAISTVSSGDPLTADSWNQIVNKFDGIWENSVKEYVDATVSANSWGYPLTKGISQKSSIVNFKNSLTYCDNLNEWWFNDWRLPDSNELLIYSGEISWSDYLITKTYSQWYIVVFRPSDKSISHTNIATDYYTRCVR